jgi:hypothetical protein
MRTETYTDFKTILKMPYRNKTGDLKIPAY